MPNAPHNYGLIHVPIVVGDNYVFGSSLSAGGAVLQPDGQWDDFLPPDEFQSVGGFDANDCATQGTLNSVETLIRRTLNVERQYSKRFLAVASGTTPQGNDVHKVAETLRKKGVVYEADCPPTGTTWQQFYAPLSNALYGLALAFVAEFAFGHDYVPCAAPNIKDALRYSPLGFSVYAWWPDNDVNSPTFGLMIKPPGARDGHWVMCYGYEDGKYWKIFDSYDNTHKKVAWSALPQVCKRYTLSRQVVSDDKFNWFLALLKKIWPF